MLANGFDLSANVENTFLCPEFAAAMCLPTPAASMAIFGDKRTLVVERLDPRRTRDGRLLPLPQEDACQAPSVGPASAEMRIGGWTRNRSSVGAP